MRIQPINYSINTKTFGNINNSAAVCAAMPDNTNKAAISNVFYYPVNFTAHERTFQSLKPKLKERSGDFVICRFPDLPCPACGKKMLNKSKFNQIAKVLAEIPSDQYLEFLGNYVEYMRPVEASVYKDLLAESQKPGASKDLRELLVSLRDNKLPILQEAQMRQIKKMKSLAKTLPEDEKRVLLNKVEKLKVQIRKKNSEAPFRRKIMIDRISKIKIRNPKKYEKLQIIAKNFPTSSDMNSAWIVKYSGKNKNNQDWDSYNIALRFLQSSISNTDHIIAYNLDNRHDDISNYMAMHSACNSQKSNKSFLQWLNEDKENRIKYMQDYFDQVGDLISSHRITKKKYKNYVAYATQTIFAASKGEVKLFEDSIEGN